MLNSRYIFMDSLIHKLNPVFKVISILLMIIALIFINCYRDIIMLSSYLFLVIIYSDINKWLFIEKIFMFRYLFVIIVIIDIMLFRGVNYIIFDIFRFMFIILYLSIFSYSTSILEITYGIERILRPFNVIINVNNISLMFMLFIRYIDLLEEEYKRIVIVRNIYFDKKKIMSLIKMKYEIFKSANVKVMNMIKDICNVMDIRLYNYGKSRSNYHFNKWSKKDSLLLVMNVCILIIVIIY